METLQPWRACCRHGSRCQLILEHLWGALLGITGNWGCLTGLLGVPWGTLAGCVGLIFMVSRGWNSRCTKAKGRNCSAHHEVPGNRGDTAERLTPADDTGRPLAEEASPPTLQSLSLAVVTTHLRLSLQDTLGLLAKGWGSQPPALPNATDEKPTLRASQKDGEQVGHLFFQEGQKSLPRTLQDAGRSEGKGGGEGRAVVVERTCGAGPERGSQPTTVRG